MNAIGPPGHRRRVVTDQQHAHAVAALPSDPWWSPADSPEGSQIPAGGMCGPARQRSGNGLQAVRIASNLSRESRVGGSHAARPAQDVRDEVRAPDE
ncbi:hypothetical protein GCM10010172_85900 [Paractinoplanes ferrugineus]|uniref:Uncharacterized protein n=1 Tax=Paractinoplanes ferrugineus TaxID=113564 RepID=A0A919MCX5_9ACTN|nr:hypothetical protein Afe05nite_70360 [Actinoplanes ferrugineus]